MNPNVWAQFGPLGLVCAALFVVLWKLLDMHRVERAQMRKEASEHVDQLLSVQRETNLAIQGMTLALDKMNERSRRFEDEVAACPWPREKNERPWRGSSK